MGECQQSVLFFTAQMPTDKNLDDDLGKLLGQQIAVHRRALNLTQLQLAEHLGVEPETISRFERGTSLPSLKRLLELSAVLQVGVGRLLTQASPLAHDQHEELQALLARCAPSDRALLISFVRQFGERLASV